MKFILSIVLILFINHSFAGKITLGFSHPDKRENGDHIKLSEIKGTELHTHFSGRNWIWPSLMPIEETSKTFTTSKKQFCVRWVTVLKDGTRSEPTEWVCFTNTPEGL